MDKANELKRVEWVDTAKGIGIFLVVFGHFSDANVFKILLHSFHMPLFFFLSGLFVTQVSDLEK